MSYNTGNKNIGIINEQGFAAGNGLGFQPLKEELDNTRIEENDEKMNNNTKS